MFRKGVIISIWEFQISFLWELLNWLESKLPETLNKQNTVYTTPEVRAQNRIKHIQNS